VDSLSSYFLSDSASVFSYILKVMRWAEGRIRVMATIDHADIRGLFPSAAPMALPQDNESSGAASVSERGFGLRPAAKEGTRILRSKTGPDSALRSTHVSFLKNFKVVHLGFQLLSDRPNKSCQFSCDGYGGHPRYLVVAELQLEKFSV
jgi:hypothetical protein